MSDTWKQIVRTVLADRPPQPTGEEAVEVTLSWAPPWAAWITLVIVLAAILYFTWIYRRENRAGGLPRWMGLLLMRLGLIAILIFMLYGLQQQPFRTDSPDLVIAIDDTQSMSHADRYPPEEMSAISARVSSAGLGAPNRWNQAQTLLLENNQALLTELRKRYNVRLYWIGQSARPIQLPDNQISEAIQTAAPNGEISRLGTSLEQLLQQQRGRPTAAIVLLTDGATIEGPGLAEASEQAALRSLPIFPIGIGSQQVARDVAIDEVVADPVAFVGDSLNFVVRVSAQGTPNESIRVFVAKSDAPDEPIDEQIVPVATQRATREVRLRVRPREVGEVDFVVRVDGISDEPTENNALIRKVKVVDATIRVLYAEAYPRFQFRFLKTLLERQQKPSLDPGSDQRAFDLSTILQDADRSHADQDSTARVAFPSTREELASYDVVILGDVNAAFLSRGQLENLRYFVEEKGGGLMLVGGTYFMPWDFRATPLESLLPFSMDQLSPSNRDAPLLDPLPIELTDLGLNTQPLQVAVSPAETIAAWQNMSQLYWHIPAQRLKPGAQNLASVVTTSGEDSLLTQQFIGRGKVMFLGSDDLWRWDYHDEFWMQTIRYLARGSLLESGGAVEIGVDRSTYRSGESATVRVRFFDESQAPPEDDGVQLTLEKPNGRTQTITMSRVAGNRDLFEASIPGLSAGKHKLWIVQPLVEARPGNSDPPTAQFYVEPVAGEMTRLDMDQPDLQKSAATTRGQYFGFLDSAELIDALPRGRQVRIQTLPPEALWNSWKLAFLFVTLLIGEWLLRKRFGLV